ncbi:hypothetical protein GALL_333560 [mine drainage metagenome]|jgi:hypothetical protein|uniref:DUF4381 domain-containing protein n=1 Tax=mine drainage metagenome TaxID=410659 RepID=A0A1J5R9I3_9ZZZZ
MIDRVAALADIVAPSPVARPQPTAWWHGSPGWLLGVVAIALLLGAALAGGLWLRRMLARRRLRDLAVRLRQTEPATDIRAILPGVWADLERAGFKATRWSGLARASGERLRYAREPSPETLREFLEQVRA